MKPRLRFDVLTIFPEIFIYPLKYGVLGKGIEKGIIEVSPRNIRDFAKGKHRVTDDYPYGGGSGMVMKPEPIVSAIEALKSDDTTVILLDPAGEKFDQKLAFELAKLSHIILVCGRYEGVDERVRFFVDREISVGDYILSGGEFAALIIIDAVSRLVPGVLGNTSSILSDSFVNGLLSYPLYTRPRDFRGLKVPDVLISGDHKKIEIWRKTKAEERTERKRPDILNR